MPSPIPGALRAEALRERLRFAVLLGVALSACATGDRSDLAGMIELPFTRFDTLGITESGLLGVAAALTVVPDRGVRTADGALHRVPVRGASAP
mgnify:CR=1 FL=1|jgi:hypothetical protein